VDVPGLAMSRSIGDEVSQQVGVISIPEIIVHDITPDDRLVVWASDGVWEFISNEEVSTLHRAIHQTIKSISNYFEMINANPTLV
jgi:serine/threonine protein phosphatase PrpC